MTRDNRHIALLQHVLAVVLLAVAPWLLTACGGDDAGSGERPRRLTIYVYSPSNPIATRAEVGTFEADAPENVISQLQIWVFEHATGKKVAYYQTTDTNGLITGNGATYEMDLPDWFTLAQSNVDVYVMANVTDAICGCSFNGESTRDAIEKGSISAKFGLDALTTISQLSAGMPMTGVIKDQPVFGDTQVLSVGSGGKLARIRLVRVLSKMRFIFSRPTGSVQVDITGITINAGSIPDEEYLILEAPATYRTGTLYNKEQSLAGCKVTDIAQCEDPAKYIYALTGAQSYENQIKTGISAGELSVLGPFYLRESGSKISGVISYTVHEDGGDVDRTATFEMDQAGDFARNHSWTVYAYYSKDNVLDVTTGTTVKDWNNNGEEDPTVYNW